MRRARIKAVATLPARRKQTVKDEPPNTISDGAADAQTPTISTESTKQPETEALISLPIKNVIDSKLAEPSGCLQTDTPISEPNNKEVSKENLESLETITKDSKPETEARISPPINNVIDSKLQEASGCLQMDAPISERNNKEISKENVEPLEMITKDSEKLKNNVVHSPEKRTEENTAAHGLEEAKASLCNDSLPITKVSQTRASFIRPIPRLDGGGRIRRNSVQGSGASASESEDDTRRTSAIGNRIRNDSASSIQSPKVSVPENSSAAGNVTPAISNVISVGATTGGQNFTTPGSRQKRKVVVSESARKLAEARREFLLKHENKQPDRAKLTMYDLIYYNPLSNPMKRNDPNSSITQRTSSSVVRPETEDEEEESETSEAMPVPQVKVGPDGHLIIDEQSLVIEHTGAKKNRQALARTEALVDEENNSSGFYKKRAKSKDWPNWETLKFYKALNGVGTDFLLMQSLFPKRSRQELKMKFKKEEKMNRALVEKALAYHQEFDIDSLKEDLATFEETENRQFEMPKSNKPTPGPGRGAKRKRNKSRRMAALSIGEENEEGEEPECHEQAPKSERKKSAQRRNVVPDECTRLESTSSSADSASDQEVYVVRATRSGRLPKVRKLQAPMLDNGDNVSSDDEQEIEEISSPRFTIAETDRSSINSNEEADESSNTCINLEDVLDKTSCIQNSIPDMSKVEPGSLVIVSRESNDESGDTVLQVYMVSSDVDEKSETKQNMTPIVLTPELLNTVANGITKIAPIDIKME